jgi:hypothetical protein
MLKVLQFYNKKQVVYILDQVKALEEELLLRIKQQGLVVKPQILVVSFILMRVVQFIEYNI